MASGGVLTGPWPAGATVGAYLASQFTAGRDVPTGTAITTAVASSNGAATFSGLSTGVRYRAYVAGYPAVAFMVQAAPAPQEGDRSRIEDLEAGQTTLNSSVLSVESGVGDAASAAQDSTPIRGGAGLTVWAKPQRINPHASTYGAVGDGTTDDYAALNAAMLRAQALGAIVELAGADYKLNTALNGALCPLVGRGRGESRLIVGSASNLVTIQGSQAASNTATLTANAARFAEQIVLSSVAGIAVGDYLLIGSSGVFQTDHTDHLPGERVRVKSIASLTVTLQDPLRDSYLTADSAAVKKLTDVVGARIEGLTFHNASPLTGNGSGLYVQHCRNLGLSDVGFSQLDGQGVQLVNVSRATLDGLALIDLADDPDNSRFGYGVLLQRATENVTISGGVAHGCRHAVTTDGTVGQWGVARDCTVTGMVSHGAKASAFDTHSHSERIHFIGCHVHGARDFAFHHRARHSSIKGGSATDCRGGAFLESQAVRTEIVGTTFERLGWIAGRPSDTSTAWDAGAVGIQLNGPEQTVRDCEVAGVAGQGLVAAGASPTVRRTIFKQCCLNSDGSRVGGSVGGSLPLTVLEITSTSSNYYIRHNEYQADPVLAAYTGFAVTTTATIFVRTFNVTGVVLDNPVYGSGLTPLQVATGFVGTRGYNGRVDPSGAIQQRGKFTIRAAGFTNSGGTAGAYTGSLEPYVEFADAATQSVVIAVGIPYDGAFDGSQLTLQLRWSSPGTSGNVRWQGKAGVYTLNSDMTVAPATTVQATGAASATANGEQQTLINFGSAITATPNRHVIFLVSRLGADALDTLTNVARLHAVDVFYDRG